MGLLSKVFGQKQLYSGGDGSSVENAVAIHATSSLRGIPAEYAFIARECGEQGVDWDVVSQMMSEVDGIPYDSIQVKTSSGADRDFVFDIRHFYGKF